MSRIGKRPVEIPKGVSVVRKDGGLEVKGPKGTLHERLPERIAIDLGEEEVRFTRPDESRPIRALHGLARALVQNMVTGVTEGFTRQLEVVGVGYRAEVKGKNLSLALGFSHPVELPIPEGLTVQVEENTKIRVEGADRKKVGEFAAEIRKLRPPEPYKGKGVRYSDEQVRRKVGKAGVS